MKDKKRYSEAFKLKVMEELRDGKWKTVADAAQAYGVSAQGVRYWMKRFGFEHLNGRIIYVKTTTEIDEIKRLKAENKRLKERLADEVLDHKIDEVALRIACRNLGASAPPRLRVKNQPSTSNRRRESIEKHIRSLGRETFRAVREIENGAMASFHPADVAAWFMRFRNRLIAKGVGYVTAKIENCRRCWAGAFPIVTACAVAARKF